jgi:chromosome partitioning protein
LLLVAKIRRSERRIGIIANRVRSNTRVSQSLLRFLKSLDIPLIATLRDTQSYVRSAECGLGVFEMPPWQVQYDLVHWRQIRAWLAERPRNNAASEADPKLVTLERPSAEPADAFAAARALRATASSRD